jgi:glycerophosphoryl diester phosphodiesterase
MTRADFALIAHRGFSSQAPENTFAAFDLAIDNGFAAIELDVQLTADGIPVVLHDGELRRVAGGRHIGSIDRLTAAEAASIDVGSHFGSAFAGERIPRLDAVLRRYSGRTHLHVVPTATLAACRDVIKGKLPRTHIASVQSAMQHT